MKTRHVQLWLALLILIAGISGWAIAQEKDIPAKELPAAVTAAFQAAYPHAVIKGAATEVEGGVTYYEIESVDGQTRRDLLYTIDGKIFEIEETVSAADLPAPVKQAVAKAWPKGEIEKAEKTTRESTVQYDIRVQSGTKTYEMSIDPQGKVLNTQERKLKKEAKEEKEEQEENEEH
jgi:hypothetical protein